MSAAKLYLLGKKKNNLHGIGWRNGKIVGHGGLGVARDGLLPHLSLPFRRDHGVLHVGSVDEPGKKDDLARLGINLE